MDLNSKQFLFIIGAPRSGTTMLQVLLASHPQVASTVELTLFNRYVGPWLKAWETEVKNRREMDWWQQGLPMLWTEEEFEEFLREFLRRAYAALAKKNPACTHLLDKHPNYSLHVHTIKRLIPNARFIHIIRDGRDVAASFLASKDRLGFGVETLAQGGAEWNRWLRAAREAARYGADYLEVRYEDFLTQGAELYGKVLQFCGLPADPAWITQTMEQNTFEKMKARGASGDAKTSISTKHYRHGKAGKWRESFSARDRYEFNRAAGPLLLELGYAEEGWWAETPAEKKLEPRRHEARRRWAQLRRGLRLIGSSITGAKSAE
jgi:hypothetical protein